MYVLEVVHTPSIPASPTFHSYCIQLMMHPARVPRNYRYTFHADLSKYFTFINSGSDLSRIQVHQ
jgi:hypothetical protein